MAPNMMLGAFFVETLIMISRCCKSTIHVAGHTMHYYACNNCYHACDTLIKTEADGESVNGRFDVSPTKTATNQA